MKFFTPFAALVLSASTALADGPQPAPTTPFVAPPAASTPHWSGSYAGLYVGAAQGNNVDVFGTWPLVSNASLQGAFIGYRRDLGDYVVGVELASTLGTINLREAAFPTWHFEQVSDLRLTYGRDMGRALVYVAGGYTTGRFNPAGPTNTYDGWNAAVGVDVMVSNRAFVGIEYMHRSVSRTDARTWTADIGALQLRGGLRF